MGVRGWNQFLVRKGWLPRDEPDTSRSDLWAWDMFGQEVTEISQGSELHVDGLSLCFHLHRVAYARHTSDVPTSTIGTFQALKILPSFLPLSSLDAVAKEFVTGLKRCEVTLVVYMDGNQRYERFKEKSEQSRQKHRESEISSLHQFCETGRLPVVSSYQEIEETFPKSHLFITQVIHSIHHSAGARVVFCDGEADRVLAEKVSTASTNAYIVGSDSDFCFFAGCRYIPLVTLNVAGNRLSGVVLGREILAQRLTLPTEGGMVELAMLLGNDYFDPSDLIGEGIPLSPESAVEYLRGRGHDYRIEAESFGEVTREIEFVRKLYNLDPLDEFLVRSSRQPDADRQSIEDLSKVRGRSVKQLVLQSLEECSMSDDASADLNELHLRAFSKIQEKRTLSNAPWRPLWKDVCACRTIERTISRIVRRNLTHPLVKLQPPFVIFDSFMFHSILQNLRRQETASSPKPAASPRKVDVRPDLPVDNHKNEILDSVRRNRVTIIQGETGCGKSSRIPLFLLNAPPPNGFQSVKMFVSQPRRLAAKALVERLRAVEPEVRDKVALRMGHGVREYESSATRAWFVTTGYLVRFLANNPCHFNDIAYIIVDEVHERSVDTDLLCLMCKRLLQTNRQIRLVLMSATLAASLYQNYFNAEEPPLRVGSRMFPVDVKYAEDLIEFEAISNGIQFINAMSAQCASQTPDRKYMEILHATVASLVTLVGKPGSSILIFVSGMNDIIALSDLVDKFYVPGLRFSCFPIHSDIPFEEQMQVFDPPLDDEVKVVIATNAAESSVTLPDVDIVICLGLQKQIIYNPKSHRQVLVPSWISKASAEQRAGRTGRVRPGTVYRVYSRELFNGLEAYDSGEMARIPLDSVILLLKEILPPMEKMIPLLLSCLEPPDLSTIDRSFASLHNLRFVTDATEDSRITTLGKFVSALGVDLSLGALIGLGIQFGVGAEAVQLAGVLSVTKDPWVISNPLLHEPDEYNEMVKRTFVSKVHFDANLFSEPFAAMNLMWAFDRIPRGDQRRWCRQHGVFLPRLKRLRSTCNNLGDRVANFVGINRDFLSVELPPCRMPHSMLTVLRVIQVWVFNDALIEMRKLSAESQRTKENTFKVQLGAKSSRLTTKDLLSEILLEDRHQFQLIGRQTIKYSGTFKTAPLVQNFARSHPMGFLAVMEPRLLSFATEVNIDRLHCFFLDKSATYVRTDRLTELQVAFLEEARCFSIKDLYGVNHHRPKRGLGERRCGIWTIQEDISNIQSSDTVVRWSRVVADDAQSRRRLEQVIRELEDVRTTVDMWWRFPWNCDEPARADVLSFTLRSPETLVAKDMQDLLLTTEISSLKTGVNYGQQSIEFQITPSTPMTGFASCEIADSQSWKPPMMFDHLVPEGARLLFALASGRRRGYFIRIPEKDEAAAEQFVDVYLNEDTNFTTKYWKLLGASGTAFVAANSVPASAISLDRENAQFSCCAKVLEVKGGHIRAEGLTLLPSQSFLALALMSFGVNLAQLMDKESSSSEMESVLLDESNPCENSSPLPSRLLAASRFHESAFSMDESLQCFPEKVKELLALFEGLDSSQECGVWDSLETNPFIKPTNGDRYLPTHKMMVTKLTHRQFWEVYSEESLLDMSEKLFSTNLSRGAKLDTTVLYSSNVLSLLVSTTRRSKLILSQNTSDWKIKTVTRGKKHWFYAEFQNIGFRYFERRPTPANWLGASIPINARPTSIPAAMGCLPASFRPIIDGSHACVVDGNIFFESLELAIRIEAAFWLERQFSSTTQSWYQQADFGKLLATLRDLQN